jgi:hypothetical protein
MKATIKILVILILVLATFSQSTNAAATNTYKYKGQGVFAYFSSDDPTGCISTGIDLFASEKVYQTGPQVFLAVYTNDYCKGVEILNASGTAPLSKGEFDIAGNLDWATLNTTVSLYDEVSQSSFDVQIDLTWTAVSPRLHQVGNWTMTNGRCHTTSHTNDDYRYGPAVGSVSNGTVNFAPLPSIEGTISISKSGYMTRGCE